MPLTARQIDSLKAERTLELFEPDARFRELAIRVSPTGLKTWSYHYTFAAKRRRLDLGRYPALSLQEAHNRARQFRNALDAVPSVDPATIVAEEAAAVAGGTTVNDLIRLYAADVRRSPKPLKSIDAIEKTLCSQVGRYIGEIKLADLTRLHIKSVIDRVQDRGKHSMAFNLHSKLRTVFAYAVTAGHMAANPVLQMAQPEEPETKDNARPLRDSEIKVFWHGVQAALPEFCAEPFARILKFSMVTGARLGECVQMTPDQIKGDVWTIPGEAIKNGKPHSIPLNALMLDLFGNGWGMVDGKPIERRRISDIFWQNDIPAALGLDDFTCHSMRRTAATHMDEMGIAESTIGLCLNHAPARGTATATRTYIKPSAEELQRREKIRLDQKRAAFDAWSDRLREIVG